MNVEEILKKYNASRDTYIPEGTDPYKEAREYFDAVMQSYQGKGWPTWELDKPNVRWIKNNWRDKIRENSVGFSLYAVPPIWINIIQDILIQVLNECPSFNIDFIGIKNCGIKFVLNGIPENIRNELDLAEYEIYDRRLEH